MPTSDAFITMLSQQLGAAPQFRDALLDALLALLTDAAPSGEAARANYLDALIDIESQHARAEQSGKTRLNAALTTLAARVREELQQSALNLHHAIKSGNQALAEPLAQQIGVDAQTFPVGLAVESNLLELSEQYVRRAQELQFLHANAPDQLAEIKEVIFRKKVENANQLDAIALEALAGISLSKQYQRVKTICLSLMQQQRVEAENALSSVLSAPNADVEALESWLLKYGLLARQIVKEIRLNPTYRRRLLRLLIASREPLALQALSEFTPPTQAERDIFDTLMTLRFGEEFQQTRATWKTRLNQQLGAARHRKEALAFWQRNLSFLPGLLADKWPSLGFNGEFKQIEEACQKEMAAINAEEFLAAQRGNLEAEQVRTLEQALHARSAAPKIEFDESELHEAAMPEIEIEDAPGSSAEPALIAPPMPPTPMTPMMQPTPTTPPEIEIEEGMMLITEAPMDEPVAALKPQPKKPAITLTPTKLTSAIPRKPVAPVAPFVLVAPVEPERSIWGDVIFPFISKNLVFVLAPTLIFIGLLLLVFTLWDKAAWIRYGLTPFMIVTVSYALARIGVWLKGEDIQSDTPIHTLQGAAIFLAPLSLLFVALLSADPKFPSFTMKVGWGAALSIVLLAAWRHIFLMATKTISAAMSGMHTMTLLLLNALLLLLPLTRAMSSAEYGALNLQAKGLFIGGFYVGFLVLFFSMLHVFRTNLAQAESEGKNPLTFYGVTALGTYLLVWGLTHARLGVLPQPHTYAPLLLLLSLLMAMFEFELLEARKSDERITSLHYFAYALVGFGVLLSIGHDYVRVLSLLLAGAVWAYQAVKLNDDRHYNVALAIFTIGFSSIALIKGFPAPYFPHFALFIVIALYLISANIRHEAVALLALRLVPVYLAFSFVISVIWQWSGQFAALPYGVAFLLFGAFAIFTGAKLDKLLHVHLGAFYVVAALPYLGAINVNGRTLDGNTMAFALSVVAAGWVLLSSYSSNPAIRDSRSTVLWNIGLLAFALLCLRLVLKDSIDFSSNPLLQVQILGGPLFIALLMFLNAYFTGSYLPVYLGLFIAVVIFPEIKNRFDIPMYSGLGSTISGIGFLATVWALRFFDFLGVEPASLDLILRKNPFPAQARNRYLLYANPLMVGAFFLFTRTVFITYPLNVFRPLMPFSLNTCIAVFLCGTAYHVLSLWFKQSWMSFIGYAAIWFGLIHSCFLHVGAVFEPKFLPLFILSALLYCLAIATAAKWLPDNDDEELLRSPWQSVLEPVIFALTAVGLYACYSVYHAVAHDIAFAYWLPLLVYLIGRMAWQGWREEQKTFIAFAHLLLWQTVVVVVTRGAAIPAALELPETYLSSVVMTLALLGALLVGRRWLDDTKCRLLSPIPYLSFCVILVISLFMTYPLNAFRALMPFSLNTSVVVFLCGAAYLLLTLWIKQSWIAFIGYIAIWFGLMQSCFMQTGVIFQPQFLPLFMLAALLLCLAIAAAAGKWLPEHDAALIRSPWQSLLEPVIFALVAVGFYAFYSFDVARATDFAYWLPLLVYLIGRMAWQGWREEQKTFIAFAHLLLWQTVVVVVTRGAALPAALELPEMYLGTAVMTLVLLASFFVTERLLREQKYRLLSPVLWLSLIFMLLISIPTTALFYMLPRLIEQPALHIAIWGAVTLLLGRFLSFSPLWLWSIFLFYSLIMRLIAGNNLIKTAFHPLPLACLAVVIAGVSQLVKATPQLSEPAQSPFGNRETASNAPLIFSFAAQVVAYLTISQALANPMYRHAWPTMLGLFVCAIPGLLIAEKIGTSRQALFLLPYTIAWGGLMLALPTHFPHNAWLMALETPHLVACGMALGLLTGLLMDRLAPMDEIGYIAMKHNSAGGILLLVLYAYFMTLDLNAIGWQRFITSGVISLIAAYYFRYFVGDAYKRVTYALFACGLTVGMLCVEFATAKFLFGLALSPSLVFYALLLPPLWFLLKSDINRRAERIYASGRDAATHLCFYLLAFYVAPPLLKFVFLPPYAPTLEHLFLFAPIALLLALMLIRLHSLEAPSFVAPVGVLLSLFAAWAGLSRLIVEIVGAKPSSLGQTFAFFTTVAVGVAYAALLTTGERGVLTRFWRWLGAIDDDLWESTHLTLLPYLLIHTHALFFIHELFFMDPFAVGGERMSGVVLLLLAGIWMIAGYRSDKLGYYWVASAEIIAALYSCRIQPAYWTEAWIMWSLLALYALLIPLYGLVLKRRHENALWHLHGWLFVLAALVFYEHIAFYGLYPQRGIAPLLLLWIITFFVPLAESEKEKPGLDALMTGMAYAPAFFIFLQQGSPSLVHLPNTLLGHLPNTLLATMVICGLMTAYRAANLQWLSVKDVAEWRVAHHFHVYLSKPHSVYAIMIPATATVALVHTMTYTVNPTLFARQYVAMFLSQLLLAAYWYDQARTQEKWQPMALSEAIFFGALLTLRQALPARLHLDWTAAWDVWAGVTLTAIMYAARLLLRRQHAAIRVPIRYTLFLAPLATIAYGVANNVGYETLSRALLVFSTLFLWQAYSEKDRFIMAYALLGVNAYLMLMLLEREVHSPQAYVTPVCLSILILAQVFRDLTSRATANFARSVALTVMLGSAMSEAIVRHYNSPLQHFILIGLSILAMVAAALLKIRIFAAFGLFGFIVDIIAVIYIVLSKQDTDTLKVILGVGFTLIGGLILTGYILYRKNKERIDEMSEEFKETFMAWD